MNPEVYIPLITICAIFVVSEVIAKFCKEKIDSLFFFMILLMICGSTLGLVSEADFDSSLFSTITYGIGLPFAIISFGASVSFKEFKGQYKTFIIGIAAILTILIAGIAIGTPLVGIRTALYGSVEIAGGGQAGLIFLTKAQEIGDNSLLALMLLLMNLQICIGFPLCQLALRKGIKNHLVAGDMMQICEDAASKINPQGGDKKDGKLIKIPEFLSGSFYFVFMVFGLIALAAFYIGQVTTVSHYVWEIILGFVVVQIGLLEKNSIHKIGAGGMIFGMMYATVCSAMSAMVWKDVLALLPKVLLFFGVGVVGCALCGLILGKIMKKNFWETFAVALGCMVGFPPSLRVAKGAVAALKISENLDDDTADAIVSYYEPQIVISGVVTISLLTGIIAGVIVGYI